MNNKGTYANSEFRKWNELTPLNIFNNLFFKNKSSFAKTFNNIEVIGIQTDKNYQPIISGDVFKLKIPDENPNFNLIFDHIMDICDPSPFYANIVNDINKLLKRENITYLNIQKLNETNFITGFNYSNISSSANLSNTFISESEKRFTCIFDDVINKLLELQKQLNFTLCITIGILNKEKVHEVIIDRIYEKEKENSKKNGKSANKKQKNNCHVCKNNNIDISGKFSSSISFSNGLTGHFFSDKSELQSILRIAIKHFHKIKKKLLNSKIETDRIYRKNTNCPSIFFPLTFFMQITIIPSNPYSLYEIKKNLKNKSNFTFIDSLYSTHDIIDEIMKKYQEPNPNKKEEETKYLLLNLIHSNFRNPSNFKLFYSISNPSLTLLNSLHLINKIERIDNTMSKLDLKVKNSLITKFIKKMSSKKSKNYFGNLTPIAYNHFNDYSHKTLYQKKNRENKYEWTINRQILNRSFLTFKDIKEKNSSKYQKITREINMMHNDENKEKTILIHSVSPLFNQSLKKDHFNYKTSFLKNQFSKYLNIHSPNIEEESKINKLNYNLHYLNKDENFSECWRNKFLFSYKPKEHYRYLSPILRKITPMI